MSGPKSLDEITGMSRQRRWQLRRVKAGLCQICGKPRTDKGTNTYCPKHTKRAAKRYTKKAKAA
jgi:hypothetical protein